MGTAAIDKPNLSVDPHTRPVSPGFTITLYTSEYQSVRYQGLFRAGGAALQRHTARHFEP